MKYRVDLLELLVCVVLSFTAGMFYSDVQWIEVLESIDADNVTYRH